MYKKYSQNVLAMYGYVVTNVWEKILKKWPVLKPVNY